MRHTTADVSAAKPEEGWLELTTELIRIRAYRFITRLKVFERLIKATTTATGHEVKVCEGYYAYPYSEEHEPKHREQTVLATRSWHDPSKVTSHVREC